MRDDFCVFILTHGRPDNVRTYNTLMRFGYTGKLFFVIDDEDKTGPEYVKRYGQERVLVFDKAAAAARTDQGDSLRGRGTVLFARNVCFDLAAQVGCRYFLQFDDDYQAFMLRRDGLGQYGYWRLQDGKINEAISAMLDFFIATPTQSIAMSQGGDWIGGSTASGMRRKAMNSFFCSVDRRFDFVGRLNDDVNTYVTLGSRGCLFLTVMQIQLVQLPTQSQSGGLTEAYLDAGTYVKSFYTVMMAPSSVKIGYMGEEYDRIHHEIDWPRAVPQILRETFRKAKREVKA